MSTELISALRAVADTPRMVAYTSDDFDAKTSRELKEASELILVLVRLIEGKSLHTAFGAPGDWGYGTPIGDALLATYRANGGNAILENRT